MRRVILAYDIGMLNSAEKKDFLERTCNSYHASYSWLESHGSLVNARYMAVAEFTPMIGLSETHVVTMLDKSTLEDWWGYKGPVIIAIVKDTNIGGL